LGASGSLWGPWGTLVGRKEGGLEVLGRFVGVSGWERGA
jgi:hypothetical protein